MDEIREIKEAVQRCRERLMDYIYSAGTLTEIELLTKSRVRKSTLLLIKNKKRNAKIETLIEIAEKIQEAKN
ncbi:hypothetical protein QMM44_01155 [Leptospira santarosai]|uniref:hypothetical protein n=1 Tax=Leptospira santarosai TaxID=28183 RepID=UPI0024AEA11C|nr:hypothetical protein [Leptospira santarosai]MDI7202058.1 hypothetical protein [Leptospira santarosai]